MRAALTILWLNSVAALAAEPPSYVSDAAQDADGLVWGCSSGLGNELFTFDGTTWTIHGGPFQSADAARPLNLVRMHDGSVACIWKVGEHEVAVSRHTGTDSRILGRCPWNISAGEMSVQALSDSQDRLWITTDSPEICRADATGVKVVHRFAPDEYVSPNLHPEGYNQVQAVEDGRHRIWVWSDPQASNYASLRGVLLFDGDQESMHTSFGTIPASKILALARADDHHLWMSVAGDGVYSIDIDTFAVQRDPDPTPKAFCCVHELHPQDADLFAVEDNPGLKHSLWRRRHGRWTCLVPDFGGKPFPGQNRSWLQVSGGLLVQDFGSNGPWYLPDEGPPAQLSWQTGFPQMDSHALIRLKDGSFFSLGRQGEPFHGRLTLPPKERTNERVTDMDSEVPWVVDSEMNVWFVPASAHQTLSQWDGEKWIDHAIPGPAEQQQMPPYILPDTEGRLWLQDENNSGALHIFDTHNGQWQTFAQLEDAYRQMTNHPPHFSDNSHYIVEPVYSRDGKRVAFRRGVGELDYYNGVSWQRLSRFQITGERNDGALGPPWFSADGSLMMNARPKTTWRMDGAGKWSRVPFESHYPHDIWSEDGGGRSLFSRPPEGCVTQNPESCVQDNLGTYWLTWKGQLYRAAPHRCIPIFAPREVNPFTSPQQLRAVFVDPRGNAFLECAAYRMDWFIVRPKSEPPHTTISLESEGAGSFLAHLDSHTTAAVTHRWQLDGGPWRNVDAYPLRLEHLANGNHVLQVVAMDDQLNTEAKPVRVEVAVHIDPAAQLAGLLADLASPDYATRKAAADAFAGQPASAEAVLRKVRETATNDQQWWIDVALQEMQSAQSGSTPASSR